MTQYCYFPDCLWTLYHVFTITILLSIIFCFIIHKFHEFQAYVQAHSSRGPDPFFQIYHPLPPPPLIQFLVSPPLQKSLRPALPPHFIQDITPPNLSSFQVFGHPPPTPISKITVPSPPLFSRYTTPSFSHPSPHLSSFQAFG